MFRSWGSGRPDVPADGAMTLLGFEESLEILGVDVSAGPEGARRAYLRLVRQHKPEQDPAGFMRLRAAYDRVRDEIVWRQTAPEPPEPPELPETSETSKPPGSGLGGTPLDGAAVEPRTGPGSPSISLPPATPQFPGGSATESSPSTCSDDETTRRFPFSTYLRRIEALSSDAPRETRLGIAREGLAACPDEPSAYWHLLALLEPPEEDAPDESTEERRRLLRTAVDRGLPGFLNELLWQAPDLLTEPEITAGLSAEDPWVRFGYLNALLSRGALERAYWETRGLLEHLSEAGPVTAGSPLPGALLDLGLRLMELGPPRHGARVLTLLEKWVRESDAELQVGGDKMRWALAHELVECAARLPDELTCALASALRSPEGIWEGLAATSRMAELNPVTMHTLTVRVRPVAPRLAEVLDEITYHARPRVPRPGFDTGAAAMTVVMIIAGLAFAGFIYHLFDGFLGDGDEGPPSLRERGPLSAARPREDPIRHPPLTPTLLSARTALRAVAERHLHTLCHWERVQGRDDETCQAIAALLRTWREPGCGDVARAEGRLERALHSLARWPRPTDVLASEPPFPTSLIALLESVREATAECCGPGPRVAAPPRSGAVPSAPPPSASRSASGVRP